MSWYWLLLPWSLLGALGWAWKYHMIVSLYGARGLSTHISTFLKIFALATGIVTGPCALIITAVNAVVTPREHRWGLRFW